MSYIIPDEIATILVNYLQKQELDNTQTNNISFKGILFFFLFFIKNDRKNKNVRIFISSFYIM